MFGRRRTPFARDEHYVERKAPLRRYAGALAYKHDSVYIAWMLTLSEALRTGQIAEFVKQEEDRGIPPADRKKLDAAIKRLAAQPSVPASRYPP